MPDADSGEDSGSVFEAQDADASSSDDEGDSAADVSDEVQSPTYYEAPDTLLVGGTPFSALGQVFHSHTC